MNAPGSPALAVGDVAGRWVLVATILGSGMALLDSTVVNVALPAIGDDLGADVAGLQWTVNGYLLPLAALILVGGAFGDRYGRRQVFTIGVAWFAVASVLCAVAPTTEALVGARVLQGVGGALLTPNSLAIVQASFRREDRGTAIGAWSALGGIAAAVGPLLGGWLVDAVSWRAVFLINVPMAAVVLVAGRHVPESRDEGAARHPDLPGAAAAVLGLGGVTFALIEAPERGATAALVLAAAGVGVLALVAFVVVERRQASPMLPLGIFSSRQFTAANAVTFVVYGALGGVFFLLVVHLQGSLGYSPLEAGAASLPITMLMLVGSPAAGKLAQRIGPRRPLTLGPLGIAAGMLLMVRIERGAGYVEAVLPAVLVFGVGLALTVAPVTATVLAAAEDRHAGVASGVNNAVARAAGLLAVAVLPVAAGLSGAAYEDPEALTDGFRIAVLITAALAAAGGVIAALTIDDSVLDEQGSAQVSAQP
ncbi:MAG: MFS transporter [Acidimicrobiia bacterium]